MTRRRLGDASVRHIADVFRVLGQESRIKIVAILRHGECRVGDLARTVGMSLSAVSHQLALLRARRVVRTRRNGRDIWYALDDRHVADLFDKALEHARHR